MPALCEQFTHRSADTIGVFPAVACTAHWVPEVLYSCAAKPWSQHLQTANRLTLQLCYLYIGLSRNSSLFYFLFFVVFTNIEGPGVDSIHEIEIGSFAE